MTPCQQYTLRLLTEHSSLSCNQVGDLLVRNGLAKPTGHQCSNQVLTGASVLRSLARRGLVVRHGGKDRWSPFVYSLTSDGRKQVSKALLRQVDELEIGHDHR